MTFECPRCGHCCQQREWAMQEMVDENQRLGLYEPPKREWVGLTHEERDEIDEACLSQMQALFAVEAKLKEKNCGNTN
jgi:Fe-S-cluster containining protein